MSHTDFKNRIDALMNILWSGGVASHSTIIEQINFLVFLRSLSKKDDSAMHLDPDAERIFQGELSQYHWDNLLVLNAEALFTTLEEVYRRLPEVTTDKTIQLLYRDAHVKVFDKPTLRRIVHEIEQMMRELEEEASTGYNDIFGDMYEYLLGKLAQAGTLGSFRTPRHIIKFITEVVDPSKGETILDPACGTAGFLVSALEHQKDKYTSEEFKKQNKHPLDLLSPEERKFLFQHTFSGFDSDFDMFKFGLINLYLHQLEHPNIKRLNTLVDTAGDRTKWDIILANPPFSGAVEQSGISEDLQMGTRATELLFLRYIMNHLSTNGRAGVVVPEGVIFSGSNAHKKIRQMLLQEAGLWAIVSLPSGVFNPYTPVKTSILFFDKTLAEKAKDVVFVKVELDGFDLGAQRRPNGYSHLPIAAQFLNKYKENTNQEVEEIYSSLNLARPFTIGQSVIGGNDVIGGLSLPLKVSKKTILETRDYNLSSDLYRQRTINHSQKWDVTTLEDLCEFLNGLWKGKKKPFEKVIVIRNTNFTKDGQLKLDDVAELDVESKQFEKRALKKGDIILEKSGGGPTQPVGRVVLFDLDEGKYSFSNFTSVIRIKDPSRIEPFYLWAYLNNLYKIGVTETLQRQTSGIRNLDFNAYKALEVPLPPLDVQKEIAEQIGIKQQAILQAKALIGTLERERDAILANRLEKTTVSIGSQ